MSKPLICLESPWAGLGGGEKAKKYLRACIRDALARNEIPWASHAMLAHTDALDDTDIEQREEGMQVNRAMALRCDLVVFYVDFGMSPGMSKLKIFAISCGLKTIKRTVYS